VPGKLLFKNFSTFRQEICWFLNLWYRGTLSKKTKFFYYYCFLLRQGRLPPWDLLCNTQSCFLDPFKRLWGGAGFELGCRCVFSLVSPLDLTTEPPHPPIFNRHFWHCLFFLTLVILGAECYYFYQSLFFFFQILQHLELAALKTTVESTKC
jgi:hypothetical protein